MARAGRGRSLAPPKRVRSRWSTGYGLYLNSVPPPAPEGPAPVEITAMSVPGSFNDWDLTSHPLEKQDDDTWSGTVDFEASGPIAFKFAANGSWDGSSRYRRSASR